MSAVSGIAGNFLCSSSHFFVLDCVPPKIFFQRPFCASSAFVVVFTCRLPEPFGEYEGDVGEYEGDDGEYEGDVGEYEGDEGEYDGDGGVGGLDVEGDGGCGPHESVVFSDADGGA